MDQFLGSCFLALSYATNLTLVGSLQNSFQLIQMCCSKTDFRHLHCAALAADSLCQGDTLERIICKNNLQGHSILATPTCHTHSYRPSHLSTGIPVQCRQCCTEKDAALLNMVTKVNEHEEEAETMVKISRASWRFAKGE